MLVLLCVAALFVSFRYRGLSMVSKHFAVDATLDSGRLELIWIVTRDGIAPEFREGPMVRSVFNIHHPHPRADFGHRVRLDFAWEGRLVSFFGLAGASRAAIPLWLPLLIGLAMASWGWAARIRHPGAGCCAVCGYDLSGLPEGVACPECAGGECGPEREL